jgi:hypothetical protein
MERGFKIVDGGLSVEMIESPMNTPKIFNVDVNVQNEIKYHFKILLAFMTKCEKIL